MAAHAPPREALLPDDQRDRSPGGIRVAVYTDAVYWLSDDGVRCDESFNLFAARLRTDVARLVLVGRTARRSGTAGHLLPPGVELLELPTYPSLADVRSSAPALLRSLRAFWRGLAAVDVVWLLGPHPVAVLFCLMALARRRGVVLGVRQDLPAYLRNRHGGRWPVLLAAGLLEAAWRGLGRACPVVVVGADLATRYVRARRLLVLVVSMVEQQDVVDVSRLRAFPTAGPRRLLSVGRLDAEKNPLLLADVLHQLRKQDERWELVVCGSGSLAGELHERLSVLGVADHALLTGALDMHELTQHYRSCDVFLHVSWTEGVPQVLFEAFAAGLPVVATDVGGVAATAAEAAVLVPPGDAPAAAEAVRRMATEPSLREALRRRGLEIAQACTGQSQRRALLDLLVSAAPRNAGKP